MRGRLILRFVVCLAAIALAACGSSGGSPKASGPASPTPLPSGWAANATPASPDVIAILEGRIEAFNRGDFEAAAAFWAEDGVLIEYEADKAIFNQGRAAIAKRLAGVYEFGLRFEPAGTPLQFGQLVAEPVRWLPMEPGGPDAQSMLIFRLNADGKIASEWVTF